MFLGIRPRTRIEEKEETVKRVITEVETDDDGNEKDVERTVEVTETRPVEIAYKECWVEDSHDAVVANLASTDKYFTGFEYYRIEFEGGIDGPPVLVKVE